MSQTQAEPAVAEQGGLPAGDRTLRTASWAHIRDLFALTPGAIHLNTGTIGVLPHEVVDISDRVTREWTGGLMDGYPPGMYTEHRAAIVRSYGVDEDEMVISHNATEGVARIIFGLDLHRGDEVVTKSHESYLTLSNFKLVRNRHGIRLTVVTLPTRPRRAPRGDRRAVRAGDRAAGQGARIRGDQPVHRDTDADPRAVRAGAPARAGHRGGRRAASQPLAEGCPAAGLAIARALDAVAEQARAAAWREAEQRVLGDAVVVPLLFRTPCAPPLVSDRVYGVLTLPPLGDEVDLTAVRLDRSA